jgi:hypothetical protein
MRQFGCPEDCSNHLSAYRNELSEDALFLLDRCRQRRNTWRVLIQSRELAENFVGVREPQSQLPKAFCSV